ncbi:hypothetical protein [Acetobacter ascendens]|uniref:hypothetical protein n=1 Tax=Acetobacter ascendens TaxID=481146 RepID=UPI000875C58E|nr:hypothetical protein [Acetobacter ascendens]AOW48229.1 hypothetical protein A4R89_01050 [Acetobacter ascendens]
MTTPDWTSGSSYTWVGPATGGVWTDASNWEYDGQPATHVPDAQTGGTITIPADVTTLGPGNSVVLDVQGTLNIASGSSNLAFQTLTAETLT